MTAIFWFIFLAGLLLGAWYLWIRGRGALNFWIRVVEQPQQWFLGGKLPLAASQNERQELLTNVNAAVRSLDQRVTTVVREWDHRDQTLWLGVVLKGELTESVPDGFELRCWPAKKVLRLSGENRLDERSHLELLNDYLERMKIVVNCTRSAQLSGQSFSLYQWEINEGTDKAGASSLMALEEGTFQLRDNLVLPIVGSVLTCGLLGTGQPLLFAAGVVFVVFLSGACKFVFIHQCKDEADEIHLQNY